MAEAGAEGVQGGRPPRLGFIVNPIAGLGGTVGLKGTDGPGLASRALALGAVPQSATRAGQALAALVAAWPADRPLPEVLAAPAELGEQAARDAGLAPRRIGPAPGGASTADDTRAAAAAMRDAHVDLLVFAGGDGTARDVAGAIGHDLVVLGVPTGVKIQSGVFAVSPPAAGRIAAAWLAGSRRPEVEGDVLDLADGPGVAPRMYATLRVPAGSAVQSRKAPSPATDTAAMGAIAADVIGALVVGRRYVLGPGTTVRAVAEAAGVPKTLIGVDVIEAVAEDAGQRPVARLVVADGGMAEVRAAVADRPTSIIVTPIGGQGFLFGRGNQQIPADVIQAAGRDGLIVVATPRKLASLAGASLLVDTGDPQVDRDLAGFVPVVTGYRERAVVAIAAA